MPVNDVTRALESSAPISREEVLGWMSAPDLLTRALVYRLTAKAWDRIRPELTQDQQCSFMAAYLIECIRANVRDDDWIHSGFEAAWELAAWLKHLATMPQTAKGIQSVAVQLKDLCTSALTTRRAIGSNAARWSTSSSTRHCAIVSDRGRVIPN